MATTKFEIRVALLGYVSVGKSTVLNALLRDKYSEVANKRTTAGINFFRIVNPSAVIVKEENEESDNTGAESESVQSTAGGELTQKADDVLKEIENDNVALRGAGEVEEKWFNVELAEPLCKMRHDTSLVLVEVPGLNESDTNGKYMKYVEENWKSFDCVVAVMDGSEDIETDEQVALLKLIKKNLSSKKRLPTIILFNKVDEPDNGEQAEIISEARKKVSQIFGVTCREKSLQQLLKKSGKRPRDPYPVCIAISAVHAFFYRAALPLTFKQFDKKFDIDLINTIGSMEVGRFRWRKLSRPEKYKTVYDAVQEDPDSNERVEATNFHQFLTVLSLAVGGEDVQLKLLQKQLDIAMKDLANGKNCSTTSLRCIYDRCVALGKDMKFLKTAFWSLHESLKKIALKHLSDHVNVEHLAKVADILCDYLSFSRSVGWTDEDQKIQKETRNLVRRQIGIILNKQELKKAQTRFAEDTYGKYILCGECKRRRTEEAPTSWDLSLYDWLSIFESILLVSRSLLFCESFAQETVLLTQLKNQYGAGLSTPFFTCACTKCRPTAHSQYDHYGNHRGTSAPSTPCFNTSTCNGNVSSHLCLASHDPQTFWNARFSNDNFNVVGDAKLRTIDLPAALSDPKHWGYVAWKCCKILNALKTDSK